MSYGHFCYKFLGNEEIDSLYVHGVTFEGPTGPVNTTDINEQIAGFSVRCWFDDEEGAVYEPDSIEASDGRGMMSAGKTISASWF